ncbi:histidine kinase-domain-containing protein [Russula earlei]|uniref:Histidine kinase-domain-containing protein n=1 Tax=Russula earlei TaxID=71964 RepID=A0ACC0U588_9AGAM|nr:histidine kinase-domain-containing protein [Russula earlei]
MPPLPPGMQRAEGPFPHPPPLATFVFDEFRRHLYLFFTAIFFSFLLKTREHLSQLKEDKLKAELSLLKAQINPHFLFNTLNSIYILSVKKDSRASDAIINLSGLMRYVIKDANDYTISLQKEIEYITNYVELQKARLHDTAHIRFDCSGEPGNKQVAPLILITYIENAFKYGINPDVDDCIVEITLQVTDTGILLHTFNKKVPISSLANTTGIVDDEPLTLELIEAYCKNFNFLQFEKGFSKTGVALQYLEKNTIDLLFLDINMPAMSGIDFYKSLHYKPMLIFTTSYSEYALESYELDAVDYLLKPFTLSRFEKAVSKANDMYNLVHHATVAEQSKYLMVKVDYGIVKVVLADILFIEGLDNYLKIHLQNHTPVVVRMTMKALMEKLNEKEFIRVHRSYIVPVSRIESVKQKIITIAGEEIPVGKNYEDDVKAIFKFNA